MLNEVEKASIDERQPLPDRYRGLDDEELDRRIARRERRSARGCSSSAITTSATR